MRCGGGLVGLAGAWCGVMLVASAAWHVGPAVTWLPLVRRFLPGLAGRGRVDHVAVTFDDGPGLGSTPAVLAALEAVDVRATFFVPGAALARHRELGRAVYAAGHELAVHGWDHRWRLGMRSVLWTVWGRDWTAAATARSVVDVVAPDLRGGATLLLHDADHAAAPGAWRSTVAALPQIGDLAAARGLALGPLRDHGLITQCGEGVDRAPAVQFTARAESR